MNIPSSGPLPFSDPEGVDGNIHTMLAFYEETGLGALAPKMLEPTRTWLAPAASAASKSCDMPIDSAMCARTRAWVAGSGEVAAATCSRQRLSTSKSWVALPSAAEYLPMHMSPHRRSSGHALATSAHSATTPS